MFQRTFHFKIFRTGAKIFWDSAIWSIITVFALYQFFTSRVNTQYVLKNVLFAFLKGLTETLIGELPFISPNLMDKNIKTHHKKKQKNNNNKKTFKATTTWYLHHSLSQNYAPFPLRFTFRKLGLGPYKGSLSPSVVLGSLPRPGAISV